MMRSTSPSHISTAPLGFIFSAKGTFSPSALFMATMDRSSSKSSVWIASKHLRRCGCTASGFFVCDRICSSSSFERKKKRANARRFVSRYSARPFCTPSSTRLASRNVSRSCRSSHIFNTPGVALARSNVLRHDRSTAPKRFPSSGSCSMMSSDPKMGSRYIQARCSASHSSSTSLVMLSVRSHSWMRASKGFLNGEKLIACAITMWSSNICATVSSTRTTYVSVSRYSRTSRSTPSHSATIFSMAVSMAYSFPAISETLNIASARASSNAPDSTSFSRENTSISPSSFSAATSPARGTVSPVSAEIFSQWRSRMPGERSARQSGTNFWNSSSSFRIASQLAAFCGSLRVVNALPILNITLNASETVASMVSASSSANGSVHHRFLFVCQSRAYVQNL